jgi:hypothetical protein
VESSQTSARGPKCGSDVQQIIALQILCFQYIFNSFFLFCVSGPHTNLQVLYFPYIFLFCASGPHTNLSLYIHIKFYTFYTRRTSASDFFNIGSRGAIIILKFSTKLFPTMLSGHLIRLQAKSFLAFGISISYTYIQLGAQSTLLTFRGNGFPLKFKFAVPTKNNPHKTDRITAGLSRTV